MKSSRFVIARLLVLSVVSATCAVFAFQSLPKLPAPFQTPSTANAPTVIPQPDGVTLRVPNGFKVQLYAEGFDKPRFMLLAPNHAVILADSSMRNGSVYVLLDKNNDGKADEKIKLLEGLNNPTGVALWKDYLYVAEIGSVKRYKYDPVAMKATVPGEEVVALTGLGNGHPNRMLLFDRKGEKMYLSVGSASNVDTGEDPKRAAINRYNPDGSGHEIYATGLRSPTAMRWYPGTDTLWMAVQERDLLGDDLVPDFFTTIRQGGFYGWPYSYIGPNEDPRNKGKAPEGLIAKTLVPDVLLGAHVAVLDQIFYTGKMFPAEYRGGAFLAQHGSWNRSLRVGYNVAFVPFKDGKPAGEPREFLGGFMTAPDKKEVWGRPVGLLELEDGSLLMSDDGGKKVWRISHGPAS